jgi:hypothetical protein
VSPDLAATHGYVLAFRIGSVLLVIGGVLILLLLEHVVAEPRSAMAEVATDDVAVEAPGAA